MDDGFEAALFLFCVLIGFLLVATWKSSQGEFPPEEEQEDEWE